MRSGIIAGKIEENYCFVQRNRLRFRKDRQVLENRIPQYTPPKPVAEAGSIK